MAKKVLVVDDEKLIVKGIRFSLERKPWKRLKIRNLTSSFWISCSRS